MNVIHNVKGEAMYTINMTQLIPGLTGIVYNKKILKCIYILFRMNLNCKK